MEMENLNEWNIRVIYVRHLKQNIAKRMLNNKKINHKQYKNIKKGLTFKAFSAITKKIPAKKRSKFISSFDSKKLRNFSKAYKKERKTLGYIGKYYAHNYQEAVNAKFHKKEENNPYQNATELTKAQDEQNILNHNDNHTNQKAEQDNPLTNTDQISFTDNLFTPPNAKQIKIIRKRRGQKNNLQR